MAKNSVSSWDTNPANNLDIAGIDIAEGCPAAGVNDAIRNEMAQIAGWQQAYVSATQASPVGGDGTQVEIAHADIVMPAAGLVLFQACVNGGPAGAGAAWETHFEVDNDGTQRGLRQFPASSLDVNFTNIFVGTVAAGTHRISLYWKGAVGGAVGCGGASLAQLFAKAL